MKFLIITFIIIYSSINSYAGVLDFKYLDDAKKAYSKGDYKTASDNFSKVNSDEARYDKANSLYKQKKYQEALDTYEAINSKDLEFSKLHNMGNAQAQLGKNDDAIKSYQDALKIKADKDTKFNLDLLEKQKKKDKKKQNKKQDKKKNNKNKQDKKQNKRNKQDKKQDKKGQNKKEKDKQAQKQKQKKAKKSKKNNPPISNMEERKWQKMLNKKEINTLLLPIRKGDKQNETKPW